MNRQGNGINFCYIQTTTNMEEREFELQTSRQGVGALTTKLGSCWQEWIRMLIP